MVGTARTIGRVAMRRQNDLSLERLGARDGGVEVVDLEPERDAVSVRARRGLTDLPMVVLYLERVQLEDEPPVADEALILVAAVVTRAAEQPLVEAAASLHVGDRDQRLRAHRRRQASPNISQTEDRTSPVSSSSGMSSNISAVSSPAITAPIE